MASARRRRRLKVMLVDDHPLWRDTLRNLIEHGLDATVVSEAADGAEAVDIAAGTEPDVVVMDINLPTVSGIDATRQILGARPTTRVLVLASSDDQAQVMEAVRAGAAGYLIKTAAPADIVEAVSRIERGELVFPPAVAELVLADLRREPGDRGPSRVRVAIAVPRVLEREGLNKVLAHAGVDVVSSVGDLADLPELTGVNVLVVDDEPLADPVRVGIDVAKCAPGASVLVLSRHPSADRVMSLMSNAGTAIGYLRADRISHATELVGAIQRLAEGQPVVDTQVVGGLVERPAGSSLDRLTAREREVLGLMAEGHSNQAIGARLYLGQKTIETHVRSIFTKLDLEPAADVHRRVLAVLAYLGSVGR